jgi:hypothetical protein
MFTVDGMQWDMPCDIERTAEMTPSEISGMLLNKQYFNDVIGTYLRYSVTVVVPKGREDQYTRLYEILTDPVDAHSFVMPYNRGNITITGRVENVSDIYKRLMGGGRIWRGVRFEVISNTPTKTHSLGEVVTRGLAPMPDIGGAQIGILYQFDGTGWVEADIENVDNKAY